MSKNVYQKTTLAAALILSSVLIAGCEFLGGETDEDNAIASARECINEVKGEGTSHQNKAQDCYDLVDGIESSDASYIRCLAIFNMRGKTTSSFIAAFEALENTDSTNNTNVEMMAAVSFNPADDPDAQTGNSPTEDSEELLEECEKSGSAGLTLVAAMTDLGTTLTSIGGGGSGDVTDILSGITNPPSDAEEAEIGETARTAYEVYCVGSTTENEFCDLMDDADADNLDDEALGEQLLTLLQTNN